MDLLVRDIDLPAVIEAGMCSHGCGLVDDGGGTVTYLGVTKVSGDDSKANTKAPAEGEEETGLLSPTLPTEDYCDEPVLDATAAVDLGNRLVETLLSIMLSCGNIRADANAKASYYLAYLG